MIDIVLETVRSLVLLGILLFLWSAGRSRFEHLQRGWVFILTGFALLLFGSVMDVTDNFDVLNKYVVIGDTEVQAVLEKFVGFLGGFVFLGIGVFLWMPGVQAMSDLVDERTIALTEEVVEHKYTAGLLSDREQRINAILNNLVDGVITIDAQGTIETFNAAAERIFGYRADEIVGANVTMLMPEPFHSSEISARRKDGSAFPANLAVGEMVIGGRPMLTGIIRDITERKAAENAKSEFIATVSHELRTPLTSIKGALGLIKSGEFDESPEKLQSMVNMAFSNSERLHKLIDDILDIEKMEAGKMRFQMRPSNLSALLEESVAANAGYGEEYGVTLLCSGTEEPLFVNADPDRLMQAMANLLSNAAKFSLRGGEVEVSLARHDGSLRVAIKDYGRGILEAARETVFEKFTQADASDQRQRGGTGLGLSIVKMIVEEHSGHIDFTTEIDKGTTFYFDLPELEVEDGLSKVVLPVGEDAPHILIVEDDLDVAHLLEYLLQNCGYRTSVAGTARQAKELLAAETFDGMTLDITLPGQNGISLLNELREQPETYDLPVVIVSANVDAVKKELHGDAVNTIEWIQKPIDPQILISRLRRALGPWPDIGTQILHVEDDKNICEIVSTIVADEANVIAVGSIKKATALLAQQKFDLVIFELELPDGNGESLLPLLRIPPQKSPPVVIFSTKEASEALAARVRGVLVKSQASNQEILNTIQSAIGVKRTAKSKTDGKV